MEGDEAKHFVGKQVRYYPPDPYSRSKDGLGVGVSPTGRLRVLWEEGFTRVSSVQARYVRLKKRGAHG